MSPLSRPIVHVVGARPNFMKVAPVYRELDSRGHRQTLIHTGQHYDRGMSEVFFGQLGIPAPDLDLQVGSGTHAEQTAHALLRLEPRLAELRPDWVLVYGDINSTLAGALAAVKLGLRTAHVEAGLRSGDRSMPEEHNRIVTDHLCDLLFTPSSDADENLAKEGIPKDRIRRVGNVMIDTLVRLLPVARGLGQGALPKTGGRFVLVTLHRPSNVDSEDVFRDILQALGELAETAEVLFPVHPRTREKIGKAVPRKIRLLEPLGYLEFLALQSNAALVVTDSGGIQEETTYLGVPCLTTRPNTERPITVETGTNEVVGTNGKALLARAREILGGKVKRGRVPPLWDGRAAERIADALESKS